MDSSTIAPDRMVVPGPKTERMTRAPGSIVQPSQTRLSDISAVRWIRAGGRSSVRVWITQRGL